MPDLAKMLKVLHAYGRAVDENDFSVLANLFRTDPEIFNHAMGDGVFELIADKLDGVHKAKRGAKKQKKTEERCKITSVQCHLLTKLLGWKKEAAVAEIARRQGKSDKQVYERLDKAKCENISHSADCIKRMHTDIAPYISAHPQIMNYFEKYLSR